MQWHKWLNTSELRGGAELLVHTVNLSCGVASEELLSSDEKYGQLMNATVGVCDKLLVFQDRKVGLVFYFISSYFTCMISQLGIFFFLRWMMTCVVLDQAHDGNGCMGNTGGITTPEIESEMQELVKLVVMKCSGDLDSKIKQNFLSIARSFYYAAYCNQGTINFHIAKVLFERVV